MKTVTTFLFIENNDLEKTILETVNSFKGLEILDSVSDKYTFLERVAIRNPDIIFIEFTDQIENQLEVYDMIAKPIFPIAICKDQIQIQKLLDKGFFDVVSGEITKEQLMKKIFKIMKFSKDILERFNSSLYVATPQINYTKKTPNNHIPKESIYLKYKMTRVKVPLEEIVYVSNVKDLIVVVVDSGRKIFHQGSLKKLLEMIPQSKFIRISNTTAINHQKVDKLQQHIVTIGDNNFNVSRMYITKLKEVLKIKQVS